MKLTPEQEQKLKGLKNAVHIKSQKRLKELAALQAKSYDNDKDNEEEGEDDG